MFPKRKTLVFSCLLPIAVCAFSVGCQHNMDMQTKDDNNSEIFNSSSPVIYDEDKIRQYLFGDVQLQSNKAGDIVILINGHDTNRSELFVLQGGNLIGNVRDSIPLASVYFTDHVIAVTSNEKKEQYFFTICEHSGIFFSNTSGHSPKDGKFICDAKGYGLAHMTGHLPTNLSIFSVNGDTYEDLAAFRLRQCRSK